MATVLKTPAGWPKILTERSEMTDPLDLDAAIAARRLRGPARGGPRPRADRD